MGTLLAACILLLVAAALLVQARQYDEILKRLNQFQQLGIKVSMDKVPEKLETRQMSWRQKRDALEKASRERAETNRKKQ